MKKNQYKKLQTDVLKNKELINKQLSNVNIKQYALKLRNEAAADGIEMTPKEVEEYLEIIKSMLEQ